MNKSLLGLIIAAIVAIIGFLIWKFFFNKKVDYTNGGTVPAGAGIGAVVGSDANKVTTPVVSSPKDSSEYGSIYRNGFDMNKQETLEHKNALTERTNNPGALFWDGATQWQGMNKSLTKPGQIIYFDTVDYGVRAQLMTLKNYTKNHGIDTLNKLTARYAPKGSGAHASNSPVQYAIILGSYLGIDVNTQINLYSNRELLAAVGYFIHRVEADYFWLPRTKYSEWSTKV